MPKCWNEKHVEEVFKILIKLISITFMILNIQIPFFRNYISLSTFFNRIKMNGMQGDESVRIIVKH